MAFTNGSLYGRYNGSTLLLAFNTSNAGNPNSVPAHNLFKIVGPGGQILLQVNPTGVVSLNVTSSGFQGSQIAVVNCGIQAFNSLPAVPTAAQIMAAVFPQNYNGAQLDIFQISSDIEMNAVEGVGGGGAVIYRLKFDGSTATS